MDSATLEHCKAWIDYKCASLRSQIGTLNKKSTVEHVTIDVVMAVLAHNTLISLRWEIGSHDTPQGYPPATEGVYIDDSDLERLRHLTE